MSENQTVGATPTQTPTPQAAATPAPTPPRPLAQVVVFDGFDEIDVFGPFEPLAAGGFDVRLVSAGGPGEVRSARGVRVVTETGLSDAGGIVVPGGGWLNQAERGAWAEVQRGELPARLVELAPRVPFLASVCSGAMLLGHAGLLRGRAATTNPGCCDDLEPLAGEVRRGVRVVVDGDLFTAGALTCGLDLGLALVERFRGAEVARSVSASLAYPPAV